MEIYTPDNRLLLDIEMDDSSFRAKKLMEDNTLSLEFSMTEFIDIEEGSWCMFKAEKYTLLKKENFKKNSQRNFAYSLLLDSEQGKTKDVKYKFFTLTCNPGQTAIVDGSPKISFPLTATPREFIQLMADNMNVANNESGWVVGECIEAEPKTLDFNDQYCFDVLGQLAGEFKTEWEIESEGDKKLIHLCKIEKMKESAISLGYGSGMGFEPGLGRSNYDSKVINRIYIKGSERNISFGSYRNTTLLMPKDKEVEYEGIIYKTDIAGSYIERAKRLGRVKEGGLDATEIYPMRIGTVIAIDEAGFEKGIYYFYDDTIPDSLDYSKSIIPGTTMTIIFQTGDLTGIEMDAGYNHGKRRIEVKQKTENGVSYPSGNLVPRVGDTYALFNIHLPEDYITDAEEKVLKKAIEYLYQNEKPKYSFYGTLDKLYAEKNWGTIGGFLNVGYFVNFVDPQFLPEGELIRIVEVKEYINNPKQPEITLANNVSGKSFSNKQNQIENQEQTIDRKTNETKDYAKRRWKDTQELIDAMYDPSGSFQNELVSSLVLEAMILRLGDSSLQYRFLAPDWNTAITPAFSFDKSTKKFSVTLSRIQHMTLGIDNVQPGRDIKEYRHWQVNEYISDALTEPGDTYYLYMQCSRSFNQVDGRWQGTGRFLLSRTKIGFDDNPLYYTLWVGFLNSEFEGNRSFRTIYGYTEILPGQMTIDNIISSDGKSFWRLLDGAFKAGGLDWNVTEVNALTILNAFLKMVNSMGETIVNIDGNTGAASFGKGKVLLNADGSSSFGNGVHKFEADGSLSLASGNILYDFINGLLLSGKFESNRDGNKIIIDPEDRSFKMINSQEKEVFKIDFEEKEYGGQKYVAPKLLINHWVNDERLFWFELTGYEARFYNKSGSQGYLSAETLGVFNNDQGWGFSVQYNGLDEKLIVSIKGLPTSRNDAKLANRAYLNGETIMLRTS